MDLISKFIVKSIMVGVLVFPAIVLILGFYFGVFAYENKFIQTIIYSLFGILQLIILVICITAKSLARDKYPRIN